MESLGTVWSTLSVQRRVILIFAVVGVFAAVLLLARSAGAKDLSLLFGGLDSRAAGDVITALDQQGVTYDVRGNAIYVPTEQRDLLRMNLAGQGLPASGSQGYEILDSLSGFSTTSQMFDAAYWRAKEGELARTILASPHIRAARVHISTPSGRTFQRDQGQTAAVTVTTQNGALSAQHVRALQFLISAAIPQLSPSDVAIIDDDGGLLSDGDGADAGTANGDLAETLRLRAERLLAARVGSGNAVVEVAVETVTESEQLTERRVDPDSRIAISTEVTESSGSSTDSRSGAVTVASNLPEGDANGADGGASNENNESRTRTNYEVSQTERQVIRAPGAVKRLTVAVLVNDVTSVAADGTTQTDTRPEDELEALRELVSSAVGIDAARGDVLTLKSMAFEPMTQVGTERAVANRATPLNMMQLIQVAVLAIVALILGLFVVRPILIPRSAAMIAGPGNDTAEDLMLDPPMAMAIGDGAMGDFMGNGFDDAGLDASDPVARLRQMISDRQPETLQVLQDWIDEPAQAERAS